jgi:hypothetical protein
MEAVSAERTTPEETPSAFHAMHWSIVGAADHPQ